MKRYTVTDGVVIKRHPLPSGDLVVTLLGRLGKWRAVARKGTLPGGNVGRLSLFHDVTVQFYRRKDEDLALLTQVQLNGALPALSGTGAYSYAHLLCELADALTVDVHLEARVYDYLTSGLRGLASHHDPELVALLYAWRLLGVAGLAPRVGACVACGAPGPLVALDVTAGGLTCDRDRSGLPLTAPEAEEVRLLVSGGMAEALAAAVPGRERHWQLLEAYVTYHVQELRSFAAARRAADPAGAHPTGADQGARSAEPDARTAADASAPRAGAA